jgi:microcystin-dependent protein
VPPSGWTFCDGSSLLIEGNEALAAGLGTTFGSDSPTTVRLPDLRSRTLACFGTGQVQAGTADGFDAVAIMAGVIPNHTHTGGSKNSAQNSSDPTSNVLSVGSGNTYSTSAPTASLIPGTITVAGLSQPHSNIQPYVAISFIICVAGGIAPLAGSATGGSFSSFGGMLMFAAFASIIPAHYLRPDASEILRSTFSGLFTLIGTTFGAGNGTTTFNLPDLRGKAVLGVGTGSGLSTYAVGTASGETSHILSAAELPSHTHDFYAVSETGNLSSPANNFLASSAIFHTGSGPDAMSPAHIGAVGPVGSPNLAHENRQPFLGITVLVAADDVTPDANTGDIRVGMWTSAPAGWHLCDGASATTSGNAALFAVIGYAFGGSGANFNLPDFRGRLPIGVGQGTNLSAYTLGQSSGTETVVLTVPQMPAHSHPVQADAAAGGVTSPFINLIASAANMYRATGTPVTLNASAVQATGSGTGHENRMPSVAFTFLIKL